jgi:TRAP-type C4-dicarboxylate transport system substrate-binding protein
MKKKLVSLMLVGAMAFSMTACGLSSSDSSDSSTTDTSDAADTTDDSADADAADDSADAADDATEAEDSTDDTTEYAAANDPAVTLVMAEVNPLDTIVGQMDSKFKEEVERLSGGSVTIDLQASGVLGSENDVLDAMLGGAGTIQLSRISAFALTSYGGTKSSLLSLPYTWESREHFWNFAESDLAQEILQEPSENGSGVRGLFYGEEGFRHFFSNKELTDITSLQGMKIRVSNDPIMNGLVEGLGASPTVVDLNELYYALSTGVVDAAEQPIANYKSNAFPEVANNLILDGHTLGAVQVIMTDDAWNSLTEAQQEAVTEAGQLASAFCKEISASAEAEVLEALKADGCNVVEVDDLTPWKEATASVIEENTKGMEDLYQQILDFAN